MNDFEKKIDTLIDKLTCIKTGDFVFNPWSDSDETDNPEYDAPSVRRSNLKKYLQEHKTAKYIMLAESPSYGCRYSGIAMTSEDVMRKFPDIFKSCKTTSLYGDIKEKTASIVWDVIQKREKEFVLWNTFVLQTHKNNFSPRKPKAKEIESGLDVLKYFLDIFSGCKIISVGKTAQNTLLKYNLCNDSEYVRHPSCGGEKAFRLQMQKFL